MSFSGHAAQHPPGLDVDALSSKAPLLLDAVRGNEATVGRHHAPPRQIVAVLGQEATDGAGPTRVAAAPSHLPVRHHLTGLESRHSLLEAELQ
jgi:hypothetical protein